VLAAGPSAAHRTARAPRGPWSNHVTTTFADLGVPDDLIARLDAAGITAPFAIQTLTIADALAGRDLCGRAPTGSGKTLAFSIPVAVRVGRAKPNRPRALLLVPTRELAAQVRDTLIPLAEARGRSVATVYGGTNINRDIQRLRRGVDVLVATPGRLADLVQRRDCDLRDVDLVVIDEADRMADMGFLPEVRRLLDRTSDDRQTLLFSATLDGDVDVLIRNYQHRPVRHALPEDPDARVDVRHVFWPAERAQRRRLTGDIVRHVGPAIVFTRTKHGADRLAKQLTTDGISTAAIHGNRNQNQRERALARFATGEVTTLVATDVAARGIHVDDVGVVVHYDLPGSEKDYIHRSGRTGRAGATGIVVSMVGQEEHKDIASLQRMLGLPTGLHAIDVDTLTSTDAPDPELALRTRGAGSPPASGKGSGRARGARTGGKGRTNGGTGRTNGDHGGTSRTSGAGTGGTDGDSGRARGKAATSGGRTRGGARVRSPRR
jgi:superfamily II DNA/RNA helicase